jgi:hypothetical protein
VRARRFFPALLLPWLLAGCLSFQLERDNSYSPIDRAEVDGLEPGVTTLDDCLQLFGAPLWVHEHRTLGVELAYGWDKQWDWGLRVSVPVAEHASASMNYDDVDRKVRGLVLLFDQDLKLSVVRTGFLRDIRSRNEPAYLEPEDEAAPEGGP